MLHLFDLKKIIESLKYQSREYRMYRKARIWSNAELKKFAHLFTGRIINVSAWKDDDKEGKRYKEYFINASEYWISNIEGYKGLSGLENEIYLDLEEDLPQDLEEAFDVVYNHTTLEHVFNVHKAFDNLVKLTKDILILVVPFVQDQHESPSYGDYWRFTPQGIIKNLENRGMEVLYCSTNNFKNSAIYIFVIASKKPENWRNIIKRHVSNGRVCVTESLLWRLICGLKSLKNKIYGIINP